MGTFADVLAQLLAADLTSLAPKLAAMGIRDMDQLNGMTFEQIMGVATTYPELERLCQLLGRPIPKRPAPRTPYQRQDVPVVGAATRGSITGAMAAARPEAREEALRNLHRDQCANNTRNTRDSRWNLWTRLAQQWGIPPLPITIDLVNAIDRGQLETGPLPLSTTSL